MRNWIRQIFSAADKDSGAVAPTPLDDGSNDKAQGDAQLQAGNFAQAVIFYRQAIAANPQHAKAHNNLAFALNEQGLGGEAEASLVRALAIDPSIADAHYLLATLLHAQGKSDDAVLHYRQALVLTPDFEFAYRDLAFLLFQRGQLHDAKQLLLQGIAINPHVANLHVYLANLYQEESQFDLVVTSLQQAVALNPQLIDAYNNLGNALQDLGRFDEATVSYRTALQLNPAFAELHNNLGNALTGLGKHDEAIICFHQALEIAPEFADAHNNLGNALRDVGKLDDAIASYRKAIEINPHYAEGYSNLGNALKDRGQLDEAVACYQQALTVNPDYAKIHYNLGNALRDLNKIEDALGCFRLAVQFMPEFADAYCALGHLLRAIGQSNDAIAYYRRAIELTPDDAVIYNSLGIVLVDIGQHDEAMKNYLRALELDPNYAVAHYNLGIVLQELARFDDALLSYRRALEIDPLFPDAYSTIGNTLKDQGKMSEAMESYRRALQIKPDYFEAHSNLLFSCNYMPHQDPASLLTEAISFGRLANDNARPFNTWENTPIPGRALRVGLVSGDFRHHPVGFFLDSVLAALSSDAHNSLKLVAYSTTVSADTLSQRFQSYAHEWHSVVGFSDERLANQIHDDHIDILIDLSGHSAHNRLPMFAWKPAPVQATWLGYFATTGVESIDYLIADAWTLTTAEENHFTETIWRLPETRLCFTAPNIDIGVSALPALSNRFITFGCFNNLSKMSDDVVKIWAAIMHAVPNSRLFLKAGQLNQIAVHEDVIKRFSAHHIAPERLLLQGFSSRAEYLAAYHSVDFALDPFPYTGGTTTVEALWMGIPVLTLAGESFISRQGVGLMTNAGLPDWIAIDADDYVARAVRHANDVQALAALRSSLREQVLRSPLFDAPRFAHHFEAALCGMWAHWCAQQRTAESRIQ